MKRFLIVGLLALSACGANTPAVLEPSTPQQTLVSLRASEATLLRSFREYSAQRPFCGDTGAKAPPLCADRAVVIEGSNVADAVHASLAQADKIVAAAGISDTSWKALVDPQTLLVKFQALVSGAKGGLN